MPNPQKVETVAALREILTRSQGLILTEYRGLTVAEVTELRKRLRAVGAEYHIVKNTLFQRALGDQLTPEFEKLLTGPTAVAFAQQDVVASAKAVLDFLREVRNKPEVKVKAGLIEGKLYTSEQVTALSKLPPREQIIAQVIGSINAPISELVFTLENILGEFVRTIQAIVDRQDASAPATEPS